MNYGNAGKGRPKGAQNKQNKALKEMILGALHELGGQDYLVEQAKSNPVAFLGLIGKILPSEIKATTQSESTDVRKIVFVRATAPEIESRTECGL